MRRIEMDAVLVFLPVILFLVALPLAGLLLVLIFAAKGSSRSRNHASYSHTDSGEAFWIASSVDTGSAGYDSHDPIPFHHQDYAPVHQHDAGGSDTGGSSGFDAGSSGFDAGGFSGGFDS